MKRKLIFTLALSLMFASTIGITNVVSAEAGGEGLTRATPIYATYEGENEPLDAIAITVIVPPSVAPTPIPQRVFPASVSESYNAFNVREVVRTYELLPHENPEWINTDSFTRNGYFFEFAELTRQTDLLHTSREHTEVLEIETARNDLEAIISGLSTTMNYTSEDGYSGVLKLNLASVSVSQNGSRTNSRTVSQTREYPHLSSADVSLIPQTITVDGRVYTLNDVTWGTNATSPVDFNAVTTTFTAVATYTRTATSTSPTGFTTRIEYTGTLTRVSTSDVRFVATFIGTPIATVSTRTLPDGVLQTTESSETTRLLRSLYGEVIDSLVDSDNHENTTSSYDTKRATEVRTNDSVLAYLPLLIVIVIAIATIAGIFLHNKNKGKGSDAV